MEIMNILCIRTTVKYKNWMDSFLEVARQSWVPTNSEGHEDAFALLGRVLVQRGQVVVGLHQFALG